MSRYRRGRLTRRARKGFRGYPVATVAFYGPDDRMATKIAVGIIPYTALSLLGEKGPLDGGGSFGELTWCTGHLDGDGVTSSAARSPPTPR